MLGLVLMFEISRPLPDMQQAEHDFPAFRVASPKVSNGGIEAAQNSLLFTSYHEILLLYAPHRVYGGHLALGRGLPVQSLCGQLGCG